MDFQIATSSLTSALAQAADVATEKSTIPVLSCVLLNAAQSPEGNQLTVSAYDLEMGVAVTYACEIKTAGSVAVPAKALLDVVKVMPTPVVRIKSVSSSRIEITSGGASFRLAVLNAEEFPQFPEVAKAKALPTTGLADALAKVAFAMSSDETRYNLNGVYLDMPEGKVVATDGHRMSVMDLSEKVDAASAVIVAKKAVAKLRKLLASEGESRGELAITDSSLVYSRPGLRMVARLVDGTFPAYQQVLPERTKRPVKVDRALLKEALGRVLLLSDSASAVTLTLEQDSLKLSARNVEVGEASDSVPVNTTAPDFRIVINGGYLMDMLSATNDASVNLHYTEELSPLLVEPAANQKHSYILMPMRG